MPDRGSCKCIPLGVVLNTLSRLTSTMRQLARAGFFYRPAQDSADNVQCFHCAVKLDGWEPKDDPLSEHLAHSSGCGFAVSVRAGEQAQQASNPDDVTQDPMSDALVAARKGTFESGQTWPHEGKRGWKCKVAKMVEAGWCFDPPPPAAADGGEAEEEIDGVTCFYCTLSLDGWEPKDDPWAEHKKRKPDCPFFALTERFGSGAQKKGAAKGKGKKVGGRASTASTASKASSRLSTQSALSAFSQDLSLAGAELGLDGVLVGEGAAVDDSIMSTASAATATGTAKGKKKAGRPKAPAKGGRGRKRAGTFDSQADSEVVYPDLGSRMQSTAPQAEAVEAMEPLLPAKAPRKGTRQSKQPQPDASIVDGSVLEKDPPTEKPNRGRKPKAKAEADPVPETVLDDSEVSAQLQEELERSMDLGLEDEFEESTPQPARPKRGVKRTSEGVRKEQSDGSDVKHVLVEFPVPPKATAPASKGKRGRQASKQITSEDSQPPPAPQAQASAQEDASMSEIEDNAIKPVKGKKQSTAKGKGKGRKASSARSSRSSKATVVTSEPEQPIWPELEEDLERDEREIEVELERIAAEQAALQAEQDKTTEFEPSPSHKSVQPLQPAQRTSLNTTRSKQPASPPPQLPPLHLSSKNATPSPTGSDKENNPSSACLPPATKDFAPSAMATFMSPTKTTRIPLQSTPTNTLVSPTKRSSPTKTLAHLSTTHPFHPTSLDLLLASPQPSSGTLEKRFAAVAGTLSKAQGELTVEAWVRMQAEKAEEELRRRCEGMVGVFEREGGKGLEALAGIRIV